MAFRINGRAKVREVKKRKWVWIVAAAVAVLLVVAVLLASRTHPVVADFQRLAIEHGLEPLDAERTVFMSPSLTPSQKERLKEDFIVLAARHDLEPGMWVSSKGVNPAENDWRGASRQSDYEYMNFDLHFVGKLATLDVHYERDSLGERVAQWFRETFGL